LFLVGSHFSTVRSADRRPPTVLFSSQQMFLNRPNMPNMLKSPAQLLRESKDNSMSKLLNELTEEGKYQG